jgi:hypothetical protein
MTDDKYVALGKLFAAHSWAMRNITGVLGELVRNEPEVTAAICPYVTPTDRVRLCIRLLEWDCQRSGVSAAAYQKLDLALRGVLDKMLVEFSLSELGIDITAWLQNTSDPWGSCTLSVDAVDLERVALALFLQTVDLLASVAGYLSERDANAERARVESSLCLADDAANLASAVTQ